MASSEGYEVSQKYFRVVTLLVKVGTSVLQKLFLKHAVRPTTSLMQHLWNNNGKIAGKRNLSQDQVDKMFPPSGGIADINMFDITLLSFLLKDTCTLSPIELTAVDDLRDCRNEIIHSSHASVSASYTPLWSKVSNIVLHITNLIGDAVFKKEIQDMIQDISHSTIDQDFMMSSVQVLRSWYDHDQDVITAMQTLAQEADKTSELRHESLKKEVQKLDEASGERHEEIVEGQERLHGQIKHVDKAAHARHEKMMEIQEDSTSELLKEIKRGNKRVQKSIKRKLQTFEKEVKKVRRSQKKIELIYDRRGERNQECDVDKIYSKHEEKMETELKQIFSSDQETIENFQRESKRKCTSQPQQHMVPRLETTTVRDFKELQKTLIELYKAKSFSEVEVSPMDDIKIPIDKIYTKLVIVEETVDTTKEGEKKRIEKPLCSYKDMFFDGNRRRKHVAVLGSAGKGKTTFCHQLAHLWCKVHDKESCEREQTSHGVASSRKSDFDKGESLRQFEYLLLIHLRLVEGPISIYKAVCSTLLEDYGTLHVTVKKVLEQHPEKVLVICDGFDEYHDENPPSREHLHGCTVLTTMRPWKYECMRTSRYEPDTVLQLKGLENKGIEELTERMIFHLCKKEDKAKVGKCIQDIRNAKLENTAKIPLILTYLVHLWYFTQNKLSQSITVNLTKLILCILQKGEEKIKGDPNLKTIPETCRKSLPGVLHNEQELEQYGGLLLCVARLAFEGLISKNKDGSLVFRGRTLDKYFSDHSVKDACFKFGLLSESKISYEGRISTAVSFYHKLIQEFFSAIHAICSDENYQELCNFCKNTENILDMGNVYIFICGLNPEIGAKFSKHVVDVISLDPRIAQRREVFYLVTDKLQQLTNLNASCLNEMEHSRCRTDHVLYITDICVGFSTPRYMECLLRNATQTLVDMDVVHVKLTKTEWQLLLHVVSESPSLQTLELGDISIGDQDVGDNVAVYDVNTNTSSHSVLQHVELYKVPAPLLPLLTLVRSTTTVTQQDNGGSDGDCTAGLTSVTTGTLTHLELMDVTMTRCEWNMLVNIVSESPSLQTLKLGDISIGDQDVGDNVAVYDVNTNTSSHSVLQHVELALVHAPLLLPLLTLVRSTTTVTQQDNGGSDGDCTAGLTSVTTGSLTYLKLEDITMTRCEWDMLVNIVSESPSLQTLELGDISIGDQDVGDNVAVHDVNTNTSSHSVLQHVKLWCVHAPLLPLLTLVRSTTTVTQQANSGSDGDCTAGLTSVTTGTLTYLKLEDITMTRCEWDMLVNIVSESPSLQTLELGDISIGDQDVGDNVAVHDVNTNTSSHSALQHVELWRVPAPLLPLLTLVRSTTTVTQQANSGSDGDCTAWTDFCHHRYTYIPGTAACNNDKM